MKNTSRHIRASQAEKLRKFFEEIYISNVVAAIDREEERRDDPGDWDADTALIDEYNRKANQAQAFAELFGGIDLKYCNDEIRRRYY